MRHVVVTDYDPKPEARADEILVNDFGSCGYVNYTFANDEDFVREKDDKLYIRRMNRKRKLSARFSQED